jgi:thiamine pyrophosphokinase
MAAGLRPERVIGDMDSISAAARTALADRLLEVTEQDSTDFAKALRLSPAPWTLAVGFVGGRIDHLLAALSEMGRTRAPVVLLGECDCLAVAPPRLTLDLAAGTRVSLWPLGPAAGRSEGLRWPLDGVALDPAGRVGTSNEATGRVEIRLEGAPVVLMLPLAALSRLLSALGFRTATRGGAD